MASPQAPPDAPNIAIVGGGIAGVTLTIALLTHCPHLRITLYESASAFGEIGAGVGFQPVMVSTMALIDPRIAAAFGKCIQGNEETDPPVWFTVRLGDQRKKGVAVGEELFKIPARSGPRGGVHRAHFLAELVKLIPDGITRFQKRLLDVTKSADGSGMVLTRLGGSTLFFNIGAKVMLCYTLRMEPLLGILRSWAVMASSLVFVLLYSRDQTQLQLSFPVNTPIEGWCRWTKPSRFWETKNRRQRNCI